jgi:hypothetical protein
MLPSLLDREETHAVLSHLTSLGYELVPEAESRLGDRLKARFVENDADLHGLLTHLRSATPLRKLNSIESSDFWRRLTAGYRVQKPERHPSGLDTTEEAYTPVAPMGAGFVKYGAADVDIHGNAVKRKP